MDVKDRDRKLVELVKLFLRSVVLYRRLYGDYQKGILRFEEIQKLVDDKGQSFLFNLKKISHSLFRANNSCSEKEQLFDLAVSSIFHEVMVIRENCYQVETYGPRAKSIERKPEKGPHEKKFLRELYRALERAKKRLSAEFRETEALLSETLEQLKEIIASYPENGLLVRFFLENDDLIREVFGAEGLNKLFSTMYKEGRLKALRVAAESYYHSGYYEQAAAVIQKALPLTSDNETRFLYFFYTGLKDYYEDDNYQGATENFRVAKEMEEHLRLLNPEYFERMNSLCKILQETSQEKNKDVQTVS